MIIETGIGIIIITAIVAVIMLVIVPIIAIVFYIWYAKVIAPIYNWVSDRLDLD
jgi:hypothetical protein